MRALTGLTALLAAAAAPALAQVPEGELPDTAKPTAYRIDLTVDPAKERFSGETVIDVVLKRPVSKLYIHGRDLVVSKASATAGSVTTGATFKQVADSGVAELTFAKPLPAGKAVLRFTHDAPFRTAAEGLHHVQVNDRWYAWSQLEAVEARRVFPGFDEPGHKVPMTVSITAPAGLKAFSNAPEVSATPVAAGMVKHQFKPTQPLPVYLLAFAVGDFDVAGTTIPANSVRKRPLDFRIIATKGQRPRMSYALTHAPELLARLEQYFGIEYPWDKLDYIASPIEGGAMENAGAIVFDDSLILLDDDAPPSQIKGFAVVAAHEMAHQWFGDLVTPRWWDDIWLNESFAEWMGSKTAHEWRPDLGIEIDEIAGGLNAMDVDSRPANRPIRQHITKTEDISATFDEITYQKGGQVIRMFERFAGPERFRRGVQLHLTRNRFGNATADQFFRNIGEGSGDARIAPAWQTFVNQVGVPLISFTGGAGSGFTLAQQRYVPIGVELEPKQWQVPVCARSGEGSACVLLTEPAGGRLQVTGTAPWVAGNADGAGYYRFDLPAAAWQQLIAAGPRLPAPEALSATDSIWAGYSAGRGDFARVLAAAESFAGHPQRVPAVDLPGNIADLDGGVLSEADRPALAVLMKRWFGARLAELGLNPARGAYAAEPQERAQLRQTIAGYLALDGRDAATRATLIRAAQAYLGGDDAALDPAYRVLALRLAARDGDKALRDRMFERLATTDDPLLKRQLAGALGRSGTPEIARETLARLGDERINNREWQTLLLGMAGDRSTRMLMLDWIDANFPAFKKRTGGLLGSTLGVGAAFCDAAELKRFEAVFRPRLAEMNASPLDLERPLASARQCIAFNEAKGAEIRAALKAAAGS
ncbi:MAG: M1 family metallopeptidase [Sphingomonadaceae bacterium]|nr:M1 family metallopeptidase [Sphingomonadaceae bacterium]